ncbi:MAG: LptF/LptG family permease, partial [Pseudomonadota bacterium]
QPGRFLTIEDDLTVHIRDRTADGLLDGLLLDDRRDPTLAMTYTAEQGRVVEAEGNTLLIMENGTVQRMERPADELTVVAFDVYGFDLTALAGADRATTFRPSERTLWELLNPAPDDIYRAEREARFTVEIHDRISQPLHPLVYALVVFLFVGDPRMHRQSRFAGIIAAGIAVAAIRGSTYGVLLAASGFPVLAYLVYPVLAAWAALALAVIVSDRSVTVHDRLSAWVQTQLTRVADWRVGAVRPA